MKTKQKKREEALERLYDLYSKYSDGKCMPSKSNKDLKISRYNHSTFVAEKILRIEDEIDILEQKLKSL
jgi:hypothetical protein